TLGSQGAPFAAAQSLHRAWQLYVAHIFLFVIFIAEVSYTVTTFNNPMYNEEMRVADFLDEPHVAIVKALLLEFQPTFLDILPLFSSSCGRSTRTICLRSASSPSLPSLGLSPPPYRPTPRSCARPRRGR